MNNKFVVGDVLKHLSMYSLEVMIMYVGTRNYFVYELNTGKEFSDEISIMDINYKLVSVSGGSTPPSICTPQMPQPLPRGHGYTPGGFYGGSVSAQVQPISLPTGTTMVPKDHYSLTPQQQLLSCNCHQPYTHSNWCNANPN